MQKCKVEPHGKTQTGAPSTVMLSEHLREVTKREKGCRHGTKSDRRRKGRHDTGMGR